MDAKIQKKIEELTVSVEERSIRYHRAMVFTGIIYAILVILVFGYTSYLYHQITSLATPDNLSQFLVNSARAQLPAVRADARERMKPLAAAVAREVVSGGLSMIPSAGTYARAAIDEQVDVLLDEFEKNDMPVIESALDEAVTDVLAKESAMDSDALAVEITRNVSEKIGGELDKLINSDFYGSVGSLKSDLDKLRTKDAKELTSRDVAEREFLFCWLRLSDIAESGASEASFLTTVSEVASSAAASLKEEAE